MSIKLLNSENFEGILQNSTTQHIKMWKCFAVGRIVGVSGLGSLDRRKYLFRRVIHIRTEILVLWNWNTAYRMFFWIMIFIVTIIDAIVSNKGFS